MVVSGANDQALRHGPPRTAITIPETAAADRVLCSAKSGGRYRLATQCPTHGGKQQAAKERPVPGRYGENERNAQLSKQEREQAEKADDERRKTREEEHITKSPHRHLLVNSYLLPWPLQIQNETPSGIGIPQPVRRIEILT